MAQASQADAWRARKEHKEQQEHQERLDAPHRVGGSFPTGDPSLTKSVWRTGWFFGLAYNLK